MNRNATHTLAACAVLTLAAFATAVAHAQVFRIVGPDGRVTYSDKPPAEPARTSAVNTKGPTDSSAPMPFELRQVANRYPVTLYTATACAPCNSARSFLNQRGIPFAERTVNTNEDAAALQRLSGDNNLPFLTIGAQQIKGYSDVEWTQFLDAAGYPKTSQLPAAYRGPAPAPLVAAQRPASDAARPAQAAATPRPAAPPPPTGTRTDSTTGITF